MKKIIILFMTLVLVTTIIGCSTKPVDEEAEEVEVEESVGLEEELEYEIGIEAGFDQDSNENTHIIVSGNTTLPDEERVIILVINEDIDYVGGDTQTVQDGTFISEPFSKDGERFPSGEYRIIVESAKTGLAKEKQIIKID